MQRGERYSENNVLHPNLIAWRHTYILRNLTIVKKMDVACYRLQSIRYTLSRVAILASTHQQPLWNFHGYWSHLNLLQSPSREAWEDKRCQGSFVATFSHLESVTESKKVGSKVWGVGSSCSKHPLNAVALWQSAQTHHLVSEERIQCIAMGVQARMGIRRRWC